MGWKSSHVCVLLVRHFIRIWKRYDFLNYAILCQCKNVFAPIMNGPSYFRIEMNMRKLTRLSCQYPMFSYPGLENH